MYIRRNFSRSDLDFGSGKAKSPIIIIGTNTAKILNKAKKEYKFRGLEILPNKAPSIAIPRAEHAQIPTMKGEYIGSARDLLAKDIRDLRQYTKAPNSSIRELIALNKSMFPSVFTK